jgi:hypothetical protein
MYLYTRRLLLTSAAGADWATRICEAGTKVGGVEINVWGSIWGPAYGTITWTAWHADLASLETWGDTLNGDAGFQGVIAEGAELVQGSVDDGLLQVVSGEPEAGADNHYVTGVAAVCAGGNIERAMTAGVELAEAAAKVTGRPTMFVRSVTGPYGGVGWLTGHGTIADVEAGQDAMAADPGWLKLVDSTGGAFVEDASITVSTLYRKIA